MAVFKFILIFAKTMEKLFKYSGNQSQRVELKKTRHKKQIIHALYFNGQLSNSELSKRVKLSTPKINSLLMELMEEKLVQEMGRGNSSGGRRPNIYGLVTNGFYVAGITINTQRTIISLFNANNREVSGPHFFPVKITSDIKLFQQVNEKLKQVLADSKIPLKKLLVIGIELPGLTDQKKGINKTYFPEVENLSAELKKVFGIPVFFNHDSKVRTFAEQHFGLARNKKNALMLQIDWGIGLGIIIDGKLYTGKSGFSGEFGHLPLAGNEVLCSCGKKGCLETMVSATAIARIAKEGIKNGSPSLIKELTAGDLEKADISTVIQAANQGDQFAISLFTDVGYTLGKGVVYLIQIFNPELVILGGRVAEARQFIMAPLQQAITTFSNRDISNDTEIQFSKLGFQAGTMGAAAYALEKISLNKTLYEL